MGSAQDTGTDMGRGGLGLRSGEIALPCAHRGQSQKVGKRITTVALLLVHHSSRYLASTVSQAFSANFPSCGASYSCSFRLFFHSLFTVPSLGLTPNPTFQHA